MVFRPVGKKPASVVFPHREKGAEVGPLAPIDKVMMMMIMMMILMLMMM